MQPGNAGAVHAACWAPKLPLSCLRRWVVVLWFGAVWFGAARFGAQFGGGACIGQRTCVRACVRACERVCVCVCARARQRLHSKRTRGNQCTLTWKVCEALAQLKVLVTLPGGSPEATLEDMEQVPAILLLGPLVALAAPVVALALAVAPLALAPATAKSRWHQLRLPLRPQLLRVPGMLLQLLCLSLRPQLRRVPGHAALLRLKLRLPLRSQLRWCPGHALLLRYRLWPQRCRRRFVWQAPLVRHRLHLPLRRRGCKG